MSAIKYYNLQQLEIAEELELIDNDLRESMRETNPQDWNLIYGHDEPSDISSTDE